MSSELIFLADTGQDIYARVYDANGNIWNGSAFESWDPLNVATYVITMVDKLSGQYIGDFPITPAGTYYVSYFNGNPPAADDYLAGGHDHPIVWDGTKEVTTESALLTILNIYDDRKKAELGGVYPILQVESGGVYPT